MCVMTLVVGKYVCTGLSLGVAQTQYEACPYSFNFGAVMLLLFCFLKPEPAGQTWFSDKSSSPVAAWC